MNLLKISGIFVLAAVVFLSVSCGYGVHQSDNWKVTVHKVRFEKAFGIAPNQRNGLVIDVSIEYVGPDGEVLAPAVYLKKGSDSELRAALVQTTKNDPASDLIIRAWLGDKSTKFKMKRGDTLSKAPISFLWSIPEKSDHFELMVGDISPIALYL